MARFNFQGYSLWQWFKGNASTIKEILKVGIPYVAAITFTSVIWQDFAITVVGKFLLDAIDYWVSK